MTNKELNNKIVEVQKLVEEASEFLGDQSEELIESLPNLIATVYGDLKQAMQLEQKKSTYIKQLRNIVNSISSIMSGYFSEKYGYNFENYDDALSFLRRNHFYSKEEQQSCFKSQLMECWNPIYMRNGNDLILKCLNNGKEEVFQTEESLYDYLEESLGSDCITVNSSNFEEEYQKYYNHLLQHGHEYTAWDGGYPQNCIADSLAHLFGGQAEFYGFPFGGYNFWYPFDFDNKEYIKYVQKLAEMRKNKDFMRARKIFQHMEMLAKELYGEEYSISDNYKKFIDEVSHNKNVCPHDILFLQTEYKCYHPRFGLSEYTEIDYFKALDMEAFRNNLEQYDIGTWKRSKSVYFDSSLQKICQPLYVSYFDWGIFDERTKIRDKALFDEIESVEHYCTEQEMNELTEGRCVIVSNENLNYTTLIEEYNANSGMNPVEFCQMIQEKYGCEVKIPEKKIAGAKMMVYSNK